jgi:hypothetical protein
MSFLVSAARQQANLIRRDTILNKQAKKIEAELNEANKNLQKAQKKPISSAKIIYA